MEDTIPKKNIAFFHPDLGIGGAERLVIDAAVGLQNRGHKVVIFTSYCDRKHCFDEVLDGTVDVRVRGNWLFPASIFSRFTIICAILRQLHLIVWIYFSGELRAFKPSAFIVDQLSAGLPLLRFLYSDTRILFYCHFPDLLLAQGRTALIKRIYRLPFDFIEQWSMSFADSIAVNSGFTKSVVSKVWPRLTERKDLQIIYPCVDTKEKTSLDTITGWDDLQILLSINRFEKKKDIGLAIRAYGELGSQARKGVRLVLAGGYDYRVQENVTYHKELVELAGSLNLKTATVRNMISALDVPADIDVLFLLSVPNKLKDMLLKTAKLLIYTPSNEHFGIVPLEAMLVGVPVLAANTGGPLETVVDGQTGWLCSPDDISQWTAVMEKVLHQIPANDYAKIGHAGTTRVQQEFSDVKMAERFDSAIDDMAGVKRKSYELLKWLLITALVICYDFANDYLKKNMKEDGPQLPTISKYFVPPFVYSAITATLWVVYFGAYFLGFTSQPMKPQRKKAQ